MTGPDAFRDGFSEFTSRERTLQTQDRPLPLAAERGRLPMLAVEAIPDLAHGGEDTPKEDGNDGNPVVTRIALKVTERGEHSRTIPKSEGVKRTVLGNRVVGDGVDTVDIFPVQPDIGFCDFPGVVLFDHGHPAGRR